MKPFVRFGHSSQCCLQRNVQSLSKPNNLVFLCEVKKTSKTSYEIAPQLRRFDSLKNPNTLQVKRLRLATWFPFEVYPCWLKHRRSITHSHSKSLTKANNLWTKALSKFAFMPSLSQSKPRKSVVTKSRNVLLSE